ncbi:MAG: hypothetical protein ACTHN5_18065 [Phycisphaerae bacterium]
MKERIALAVLAVVGFGSPLFADSLLVDRGLPTANLNNAAGANRSNVAWADAETSPTNPDLVGDNFTITGTGSYHISSIRVWTTATSSTTGLSLVGGLNTAIGTLPVLSSSYTSTPVTYSNGDGYQTQSGAFDQIYQLDFAVNIDATAGQTYNFFLNGPTTTQGSDNIGPYLLASNAGLSGSTQDGADGLYSFYNTTTGAITPWDSAAPVIGGWDKSSDINVQVVGTAVPLPSAATMGLGMLGLIAAAGIARKKLAIA